MKMAGMIISIFQRNAIRTGNIHSENSKHKQHDSYPQTQKYMKEKTQKYMKKKTQKYMKKKTQKYMKKKTLTLYYTKGKIRISR